MGISGQPKVPMNNARVMLSGKKEEKARNMLHKVRGKISGRTERDQQATATDLVLCMVLLQTEEKKVRKKLQGGKYTMLETRKDGTKFTNKALKEVAEKLQTISRTYDSRQQKLVEEVGLQYLEYRTLQSQSLKS